MTRISWVLVLGLVLAGCSEQGWFGVTRSGEDLVVLSGCSNVGFERIRVGPDTGEVESGGVLPVLTDIEWEARWLGDDDDAPTVVSLGDPRSEFEVEGTLPSAGSGQAVLVQGQLASSVVVGSTLRVVPSELSGGRVLVSGEVTDASNGSISRIDFDARVFSDCGSVPVLLPIAAGLVGAGLVAAVLSAMYKRLPFAARRRAVRERAQRWRWWGDVRRSAPDGLVGLWFGLTELADGGWHIYVAGTDRFDPSDETAAWAVGPYRWWPPDQYYPFPDAETLGVGAAAAWVSDLAPWKDLPVRGVAVGYDAGDFEIVYDAQNP